MKRALVLLCFAVSALADDAETAKGLENFRNIYELAQLFEVRLALGTRPDPQPKSDPWGTEYRVDIDAYRIVSAGSDRKFDEASWQTSEQFTGTEGDVVFEKGQWIRTNHNWLCKQVTSGGPLAANLHALRVGEAAFMTLRTEPMRTVMSLRLAAMFIERLAKVVETHGPIDAPDSWGTPLRIEVAGETLRIVSAGADRVFDPESWNRPPVPDPAEDIVFENGAFTRRVDETAYMRSKSQPAGVPVKQPPDARLTGVRVADLKEKGNVTPPVVLERVEPVYPEPYRLLRISGIVIMEAAISETGAVGEIAVLKSIGPAMDMAAVDALRRWKFKPAMAGDEPIPVVFNLTINFKLE